MHCSSRRLAAVLVVAIAGCGDNSNECGEGTKDEGGVCVPAAPVVCGDGTRLEAGRCVVDPTSCQAGTALIGGRCVDPGQGLTVDLEESAEPNGLAIAPGVEASAAPAGTIALEPAGRAFVIHGHLTPFRDADHDGQLDPDVDSYAMTVTAPTLLDISVDGVGGAQGAFYLAGDATSVPGYERYGLDVARDTAVRRVFLPAAGRYTLAITDTRALAIGAHPPPAAGRGAAAGGPDAEYYVSITQVAAPAPSTGLTGALTAGQVAFVTAALGAGSHRIGAAMPGAALASLAVLDGAVLQGYAVEAAQPAELTVSAAAPVIVVDAVYNEGPAPEPFTITIP